MRDFLLPFYKCEETCIENLNRESRQVKGKKRDIRILFRVQKLILKMVEYVKKKISVYQKGKTILVSVDLIAPEFFFLLFLEGILTVTVLLSGISVSSLCGLSLSILFPGGSVEKVSYALKEGYFFMQRIYYYLLEKHYNKKNTKFEFIF